MKTFKKILCTLLVVVMCLTAAPLEGFVGMKWPELPKIDFGEIKLPEINFSEWFSSKASAVTEGYYTYTVTNGKVSITDVDSSIAGDITVPSTLGGYSVTIIEDYAFNWCDLLTSVTIPDSVTIIGSSAFAFCNRLTSVTIGNSVTTIEDRAFEYCYSLTNVTIGNSVTTIGEVAFYGCNGLTSVTIPDSVTTIGDRAFEACDSLTSVIFGNGVNTIGDAAFYSCDILTSITIPDSVTTIGDEAFYSCDSLTSVTIPDSVTSIGRDVFKDTAYYNNSENWENSILYIGKHLIDVKHLSSACTIKNGTLTIADCAFNGCHYLTSVTIPDSVITIGSGAFGGCWSLESVTIGNGVSKIGGAAFASCSKLTSITIPDSVTTIGDGAFRYCCLTSITIPGSVATIGNSAFEDCYGLKSVTIGNSVTTIGDAMFKSCFKLTSVTIGNSVTSIGEEAFCNCGMLTSVNIPDSVTEIGDRAFESCDGLTSINIPNSVATIGNSAFEDCYGLINVTIGNGVTIIGERAFYGCSGLTDVYYEGSETKWSKITIGSNNTSLTNATIHYNFVMPDSGEDDDSSTSSENFQFSFESYSINMGQLLTDKGVVTLVYKSDKETISNFNVASIDFEVSDNSIFRFKEAYIEPSNLDTMVKISCWVEGLKLGSATLTATLPDGTTASCEIEVTEEKINDGEEEEEVDNNLINTEAENDAFVQQHLIFRKAYYDYFTKNLRWASEIWNHMDTAATLAAELAYDIIEGALEIVSLKFLDGLEVAANPYDVILLDFLASNISQSHFAKNAKEDALTVAVDIVNKAIKIFSDDSKWDPDFDIKNEVKLLITSSDYSQNNLYLALDNLHDGDYSDKITKIFNGFDCFGQVMKAVTAGAKFADMFVELLRYTVAIESFYNSTAVFKSVLDAIATEMEVNNPVFASYFANALEFYEESLTYDSIVEYVIKNKGVGDTAKLIYDMSTNVISDATVSFIMKAFKVGKDVARKVNAALWSAEVGWGLSNLLTGNNVSIGCRRMLRATYALDVATYNVMERFGTILDRDESYGAALCFDSSFNIFKMTQLYSLEQYKKYCENMATRPFTFNKSEFKNADEFLTAATVTWKDINCHYVGGSSSFRTSRVDTLRVACPTDIYAYRKSDNKLVASVINNRSKLYDDSVAILCIDGEKSFAATDMDDYRIEIKATDNGTMNVTYNKYVDFNNTDSFEFEDFKITKETAYDLNLDEKTITKDDSDDDDYQVGDIIQFGLYPQSKVTDSEIIAALNSKAPSWNNWTSYGYYAGKDEPDFDKQSWTITKGDWMRYTDITYNGDKYRGVKFTKYRPMGTIYTSSTTNALQDDNGYSTSTVYWFKFEPIDWRILDPDTGFIMSETIIDSQAYSDLIYYNSQVSDVYSAYFNDTSYVNFASDYETSSIREWLNNDFYNTAFTELEKTKINTTLINNDSYYTLSGREGYEKFDSKETADKIFLLSYSEVIENNYGFDSNSEATDVARMAYGTDYAYIQGVLEREETCVWWLRTPKVSYTSTAIDNDGSIMSNVEVMVTAAGIRPALKLKDISNIYEEEHKHSYIKTVILPTCEEDGYTLYKCECGDEYSNNYTFAKGHNYVEFKVTEATCTQNKVVDEKCTNCGKTMMNFYTGTAKGHIYGAYVSDNNATCAANGTKTAICARCKATDTKEELGTRKEHDFYYEIRYEATCTEEGTRIQKCHNCDWMIYEHYLDDHSFGNKDSKCKDCGYDRTKGCSCKCHKGGITGFFFKIGLFFQKIFKKNKICNCGKYHY